MTLLRCQSNAGDGEPRSKKFECRWGNLTSLALCDKAVPDRFPITRCFGGHRHVRTAISVTIEPQAESAEFMSAARRIDGAQEGAVGRILDRRSAGDNNWDTAANWSTDSVPGSADDVTIDIAANVVRSERASDAINSLTSTQPLTISGGSLSIAAASTVGRAPRSPGALSRLGNVTVSGLVTLTGGTPSARAASTPTMGY